MKVVLMIIEASLHESFLIISTSSIIFIYILLDVTFLSHHWYDMAVATDATSVSWELPKFRLV